MDRPLDRSVLHRRTLRRAGLAAGLLALGVVSFVFAPGWVRPSVSLTRIRTALVERGPVEATITATGRIIPRFEHVITSPIDSRVQEILHAPGDAVAPGDPIVALDNAETKRSLQKLDQQIALKENERRRLRLELEETLAGLQGELQIKDIDIESHEIDVVKYTRLSEQGLVTEDILRSAENARKRSRIERTQLARSIELERKTADARLAGVDLEVSILKKDRADIADRLERATASSGREGIVTWVIGEVGAAVARGSEIARIADLSSFRVEASFSDTHAEAIAIGLPATIRVGDTRLRGRIATVFPTVENGTVTVELALDEPSHPALRPNLRVDVHVVTDRHDDTLFVPRGAFVNVDGHRQVYVIRDDLAVRTPVEFGILNFDAHEVLSGLDRGDRVILTDMSDYAHVQEVRIR
ncbi:HlyD family efflux transporter periplasmic adaptor subunit [bacterium]|nr:HlyD family efflux transporter periplasmic adaptor subunit [bacterium]